MGKITFPLIPLVLKIMDIKYFEHQALLFIWIISPIILGNLFLKERARSNIFLSAICWTAENSARIVKPEQIKFKWGNASSLVWFIVQSEDANFFEICLERYIPRKPFLSTAYQVRIKSKTLIAAGK